MIYCFIFYRSEKEKQRSRGNFSWKIGCLPACPDIFGEPVEGRCKVFLKNQLLLMNAKNSTIYPSTGSPNIPLQAG